MVKHKGVKLTCKAKNDSLILSHDFDRSLYSILSDEKQNEFMVMVRDFYAKLSVIEYRGILYKVEKVELLEW